jgi:hypothetical protein
MVTTYYSFFKFTGFKKYIFYYQRLKRSQRPNVRELINHSWFMESNGLKLEMLKDEKDKETGNASTTAPSIYDSPQVIFRLKVIDKTKRKSSCATWPDNEEVEFQFDVDKDEPENVVKDLKDKTSKIGDEDLRYLSQCIRDKCLLFRLEREEHLEEEGANMSHSVSTVKPSDVSHNHQSVIIEEPPKPDLNQQQQQQQIFIQQQQQPQKQFYDESMATSDQVDSANLTKSANADASGKKDLQMKITITDLAETAAVNAQDPSLANAQITVQCLLELDDRERVKFYFNLNHESAQDITNRIVNSKKKKC